jgi:uncharacterized membrane protein YGL010W
VGLAYRVGNTDILYKFGGLKALGWVAQIASHKFCEGNAPALLESLQQRMLLLVRAQFFYIFFYFYFYFFFPSQFAAMLCLSV